MHADMFHAFDTLWTSARRGGPAAPAGQGVPEDQEDLAVLVDQEDLEIPEVPAPNSTRMAKTIRNGTHGFRRGTRGSRGTYTKTICTSYRTLPN